MAGEHHGQDPSFFRFLEWAYQASVHGVGRTGTAQDMARTYLARHGNDPHRAARALIRWQNTKAATAGFISGLGPARQCRGRAVCAGAHDYRHRRHGRPRYP
ncbi:hypothetical protein [Komagataeibacter oboediens]|uniref:hypothetical protein n=1 Tax=Komagataeibacter oboediens TaxID=65958 RepID=UPI0021ACADF5|nr:hypothetical protein [Komagataeibacter oboediens]